MKNTSVEQDYGTFQNIFPFWDILERDLKSCWYIYAWYENYIERGILGDITSIFPIWDILQHDLKEAWNCFLRWKLDQVGNTR